MALYHYTSRSNMEEIRRSGWIYASHEFGGPHGRDAMMGEGVYLTDIPPQAPTDQILKNNYGAAASRIKQQDPNVCQAYVQIPSQYISVQSYVTQDGRKVFYVPTNQGLNVRNLPCQYGIRY